MSPHHFNNARRTANNSASSAAMLLDDLPSSHIILDENEKMDIDGALDNSLLSELPGSDFR